jgi:tight adherence protein B
MAAARLRRSKRSEPWRADTAEALRALEALLRSGVPPRVALQLWHRDAPQPLRVTLRALAGRVRLGAELESTIGGIEAELGGDALALACVFGVHGRLGGDLAGMVARLAAAAEERAGAIAAGKASGAGAALSGRIVAGLPLLLLPFAPLARSPILDPLGILMLLVGGAFAISGLRWVARLVPTPPRADEGAVIVAEVVACALDGGAPLHSALSAVCDHAPEDIRSALLHARAAVRLGARWPYALNRSQHESLRAISSEVERAMSLGVPVAAALRRWASAQRAARRRDFDAAMRRAPVLMVVPLSACVLPAYLLLGLGPYVRALLQ